MSIQDAAAAVGEYEPTGDWKINPDRHAQNLPASAGPLSRILHRSDLRDLMSRFTAADARADRYQRRYKRFGHLAIWLNTAAAITGAIALFSGALFDDTVDQVPGQAQAVIEGAANFVPAAQVIFILSALIAAQIVIRTSPFDKWMRARAEAEIVRNEMFWRVMSANEEVRANELPVLPLQVEYFRRYQLQTQLSYYALRGKQHKRAAEGRATRRGLYTAIGGFLAAPIPFFATSLIGTELPLAESFSGLTSMDMADVFDNVIFNEGFALAGIIIGSLLSSLEALRLLSQDTRNASRYSATYNNLRFLTDSYLNPARQAAANGDQEAVLDFVTAVNDQISSEHKEWILLQEENAVPEASSIASQSMRRLRRHVS